MSMREVLSEFWAEFLFIYLFIPIVFAIYVIATPLSERFPGFSWEGLRSFIYGASFPLVIYFALMRNPRERKIAEKYRRSKRTMAYYILSVALVAFLPVPFRYALPLIVIMTVFFFHRTYRIRLEEMGYKS
ncbi:hypothetical protein [Thermococcus thioreducens]|uniref:Uncharacterized protein n=1 Tax=Thermococcus thioreducens TaxID=277988 RepID=A0A0Q2UMF8_9EURY|nr:hypothetical protein [Thermococcus thioreducens]ASJ11562.1 hypothetical protein A3L14_01050 [Thermococcus thioreducens]KQH81832.1 hypothetical protein AMR53_08780 [Thermococcus thioreducens]SEW04432.1 hypothetical protein SAMN05216170_1220 [Thermococcus thioreducens]